MSLSCRIKISGIDVARCLKMSQDVSRCKMYNAASKCLASVSQHAKCTLPHKNVLNWFLKMQNEKCCMSSIGVSRCKMYNAASKCLESCVNMQKKINSNNFVEHEKMKITVRNFKVLDYSRRQRLDRQALEMVVSTRNDAWICTKTYQENFWKATPKMCQGSRIMATSA